MFGETYRGKHGGKRGGGGGGGGIIGQYFVYQPKQEIWEERKRKQ